MLCSIAMLVYRRVHLLKRVFLKLQLCKKSLRYVSVWPAHPWSIALSHWANHSDRSTKGAAAGLWLNVLFAQKKTFHVVCVCVYVFVFVYVYVYIYILNVSCGIMSLHFDWSVLTRCRMSHRSRELPWPTTCCSRSQESHGLHEQSKGHQFLPKRKCKPCTRR
jgi:high-affinity Fe2+/Pb2+ permease